jgi:hypothetical protein
MGLKFMVRLRVRLRLACKPHASGGLVGKVDVARRVHQVEEVVLLGGRLQQQG